MGSDADDMDIHLEFLINDDFDKPKDFQGPLKIGILIVGDWQTTKIPLEYLILLLNSKQSLFEYELLALSDYTHELQRVFGRGSRQDALIGQMLSGSEIDAGKLDLKHTISDIATALKNEIERRSDLFDQSQNAQFFIFITTSKHIDVNFFQDDGSNGFNKTSPCRGAIIMTGHHERKFAPPTVIEFIYKFIFRTSVKWACPEFTRDKRHFGQKSCLFDFNHDISFVRYLVLHNFICFSCRNQLGAKISSEILDALDCDKLYGSSIERHPAKISSELGFNLSHVKGIYKTRGERIRETISDSFLSRLGSLFALSFVVASFYATGTQGWFLNED